MRMSELSSHERRQLSGKTVRFRVRRGGEMVDRYGTISRMKDKTFFVGASCYSVDEAEDFEVVG